jgi:Rrf2 family protein
MSISQKCLYALRALIELARHRQAGPLKISDIATVQAIPSRFLEVILNELRQGGFVESRRGKVGGYLLARPASEITVGEILRFMEGPFTPAEPQPDTVQGALALNELWGRAENSLATVYDATTLEDILTRDAELRGTFSPDFAI